VPVAAGAEMQVAWVCDSSVVRTGKRSQLFHGRE
jgi:hypothetical protein